VDNRYSKAISDAKKVLVQAVLDNEPELEKEPLRLDERVRELTRELGRDVLVEVYEALADRATHYAKQSGMTVQRRTRIEVLTVFGVVAVTSPYLWNSATHQSARPVKTELGMAHRRRSPALERALTDLGSEESFAQADRRLKEHDGFSIGPSTVLRVVEGHARRAEAYVAQRLEQSSCEFKKPPAERPGVKRMVIELDGCEIRTGTLEPLNNDERTPVRQLKKRKRNEAWREVRVGLARPLGEVERAYVARMDPYPPVVAQLFGAACERGLSSQTEIIAVTDGGQGLREELDAQFADLRYVLDRPHLKSHLYETADAIGLKNQERETWVTQRMQQIDAGNVAKVIEELAAHKGRGRTRAGRLKRYLNRFRDAVHYDAFREQGLPIGSGEVESAHRTVPQKRLKLPGTWWHPDNLNPMLALRVVRANDWWEDYWNLAA